MPEIDPRHARETFRLVLIKPSRYDDDGYVIQWLRSAIPTNTLAVLNGIALDCIERDVLGDHVDVEIDLHDETNTRIQPKKIIQAIQESGGKGMVALVGVQSNQFPRAIDIARPLRAAGIQVCIGGFHVSGCLSMLPELPADIRAASDMGISLFAGEAEGRFDRVLQDAFNEKLEPLYDYISDLPELGGVPVPVLPAENTERIMSHRASFDAGRGCPFQCSFCTIINVQGRKSRYRTADDIEEILRINHAQGIRSFFISDDNFARNRNWEAIFDRIIEFQEREKIKIKLVIQVDALCHKTPDFIEKAHRAGVNKVFVGLENINPENLKAAGKRQNQISEYRAMLHAWKDYGTIIYCGYILGFPTDTPERILNDIETIKRELPVDLLEFTCLTPLPGSADHKQLDANGTWMDPDMNNYDLEHVTTEHPMMSQQEFRDVYSRAWEAFYTPEHVETLMRRAVVSNKHTRTIMKLAFMLYYSHTFERVHPQQSGIFRLRYRRDRRHGMPIESPLAFYPRLIGRTITNGFRAALIYRRYSLMRARVERDPNKLKYTDAACGRSRV